MMATMYERLGVKRVVNGIGLMTKLGGSIMRPEVLASMSEAAGHFVDMNELLEKAGKRVAELVGVEGAYISSGAAGGIAVATAACIAGKDPARVRQLPNTEGMKNEVIIQKTQKIPYEQMIRLAGGKIVEVGQATGTSSWEIEAAITEKTVAVFDFPGLGAQLSLPLERVARIAKKAGVYVLVDAACWVQPISNFRRFIDMGADLAIFSGGKQIRGPQGTGLILGRKDLIEACALNACPKHAVGRPMKVSKEDIVGLVTALELFLETDFEKEWQLFEEKVAYMVQALSDIPHVKATAALPPFEYLLAYGGIHPPVPVACLDLDEEALGMSRDEVMSLLESGDPRIVLAKPEGYPEEELRQRRALSPRVAEVYPLASRIAISPRMLLPGEEREIVSRLREILMVGGK
jgi:L-seryl-tRNA(Ser) seleniumtransferase